MGLVEESSDVASAVSISQADASPGSSTSSPSRSNSPPEVPETSPASPAVDIPAMAPIHNSTSHSSSSASSSSSFGPMAAPLAPPCNFDDQNDDESESNYSNDQLDRTIRFPPGAQLTTYHPGADIAELAAYRSQIWYQYDELKHMKRTALALAKDAQRGLGALLTHTYGRAQAAETQSALTTWTTHPQSRRGLERWMNDEYAAKRSDIRKRTIQSVIRAQAKLQEQQQQHNTSNSSNSNSQSSLPSSQSSSHSDDDYSIKVLSRLSEAFSVDSRQFAQGMGLADQVAAQQAMQETDDTPLKNSKMQTSDQQQRHPSSPLSPRRRLSVNSSTSTTHNKASSSSSSSSSSSHATLPSKRGVPKPPRRPGGRGGRSMGITAPSVSADFRHYY